ncbi:MAG: tRNA uridine(34) 5-carboxymethylaminomethyl modification radical SAM/GNAT enzyme Elp3 [Patescibacteria group bacterium]
MTLQQLQKIIKAVIIKSPKTEKEFFNFIRKEAGKIKNPPPEKSALLSAYHKLLKNKDIKSSPVLEKLLTKRAVRTLSGVAVISVLTKPYPCPGRCLYCPTEKNMPKSYLANEPAVMRAILNDFDPYRQIKMRLKALEANGHNTDKIELIIMGGTWSSHSPQYQSWFIKRCFEALNGRRANRLKQAQKQNETAKRRCIGLTLETRPDYITEKEIKKMRGFGGTRVELGIQHIDDKILKLNRRGHTVAESIKAINLLKRAGFKINYHLMLNLPGSTPAKDLAMFKKIYSDQNWRPDMIKIYPCVVTKNSGLYELWRAKKYKPYSGKQLIDLLIKIKKITPPFVRIARLIRDIPEGSIMAGNKITNLRQLIQERAQKEGWYCKCLRCREAGHQPIQLKIKNYELKIKTIKYKANNGTEYFLSYESRDGKILYAFLRLRLNNRPENNFMEELRGAAIIRELHTYGQLALIGEKGEIQHLGLGKKLLKTAEKICRENRLKKIAVISGIGVRKYYEKFGYRLEGSYMIKNL